jgi:hypothetical protein
MPLTREERGQIINDLVANHECWRDDQGRKALEAFSDDKLASLKAIADQDRRAVAVANAAVNGFVDPTTGTAYRVNPESGSWERGQTTNAPKKVPMMEDDEEEEDVPDDEEEETPPPPPPKKKKKATTNAETPRINSVEDLIRFAPPHLRDMVENKLRTADVLEQREREKLVGLIIANLDNNQKARAIEWLQDKPIAELENMLAVMPKMPSKEEVEKLNVNRQRIVNHHDDDMLGMPKMTWEKIDQEQAQAGTNNGGGSVSPDGLTDEDWLRNAPPGIRQAVQNALIVESRERALLIDQIVANVHDEDKERKLRQKLAKVPLEDLRDMLAIAPKREAPRPHFGGASVPLANSGPRLADSQEDLLPPPTFNWADDNKRRGA